MAAKRPVAKSTARGNSGSGGSRRWVPIIAVVLIGFVLVESGVIFRRVLGAKQQTDIRKLREKRNALEAERVRLESDIRDASGRARLQPIAEQRLNMHIPTADQQVILPTPPKPPKPRP